MIRAVVFDVGETLVDETRAWTEVARAAGVTPFTLFGALGALIERDEDHRGVWDLLGVPRPTGAPEILSDDLYADAAPTLSALAAAGYALGLAGNQPEPAEATLAALGLPVRFIASSAGWGGAKPSPEFFRRVIAAAGVPAGEIAYVGDRLDNDVLPARAAGLRAIFIRRGPWGHVHAQRPEAARADARIDSLTELGAVLAGWRAGGLAGWRAGGLAGARMTDSSPRMTIPSASPTRRWPRNCIVSDPFGHNPRVKPVYVTGHKNPDMDSIGAAIGLAELKTLQDPDTSYVPVRLGDLNPQTKWVLDQAGLPEPEFLAHVMVRAMDVMTTEFPCIREDDPVREAGLAMSRADAELIPVVNDDGVLTGVVTTRALARRYIRESRESSTLREATYVHAVAGVLAGELITGEDTRLSGRVWAHSMDQNSPTGITAGDVVVIGNRPEAQRMVIERGISLLVISNGASASEDMVALAKEHDCAVIASPLDTYVSARMITLAAPCRGLMEKDPLIAEREDLSADVSEQIKESHHGTAVVVDESNRPVGIITRADLVSPEGRRVILVDHAEKSQAVAGVEEADIVEILDHHHIGTIETKVPVLATFDPVGSTSTLVVERFRRNGIEPSRGAATALLGAALSDTLILKSPTTTSRDAEVIEYLADLLDLDYSEFGQAMFKAGSDVSDVPADEIVRRDAKDFQGGSGLPFTVAQIEVFGRSLLERKQELLDALQREQIAKGVGVYALMVTDILDEGTDLLVAGDAGAVSRAFGKEATDSVIELPGVMSRKKQVAPKLLSAL